MSADPLLDKMDALLKKHKGDAEIPAAAATSQTKEETDAPPPLPDDAWLPVLTDVVAMGEPTFDAAASQASPAQATAAEAVATPSVAAAPIDTYALANQIMGELEPRLSTMLRDRLVAEVRNSLDDTLSDLLAQMDVHIREIVRETIAEELGKP